MLFSKTITKDFLINLLDSYRYKSDSRFIIFDIDDTIMDTTNRRWIIYEKLKSSYNLPYIPIKEFKNYYNLTDGLKKYNFNKTELSLINQKFLKSFLSNKYLKEDIPFPGVRDFIQMVYDLNYNIIFLTGRDKKMRKATIKSFNSFKIPINKNNILLIMKNNTNISDLDFKLEFIKNFYKKNKIICIIDNDSEICNAFRKILNDNYLIIKFNSIQRNNVVYDGLTLDSWL
ncbi:MAG: HAD family hydrolase [Candidatus Helarchaeota archaeon]